METEEVPLLARLSSSSEDEDNECTICYSSLTSKKRTVVTLRFELD